MAWKQLTIIPLTIGLKVRTEVNTELFLKDYETPPH